MDGYYAVLEITNEGVLVHFPDLKGCIADGKNMEEALHMAIDALARYLETCEKEYIKEPSYFSDILKDYSDKSNVLIMKIPIDKAAMLSYRKKEAIDFELLQREVEESLSIFKFGNLIEKIRSIDGTIQKEFAKKINSSKTTASEIESGKNIPSIRKVIEISRIFEVPEELSLKLILQDYLRKEGLMYEVSLKKLLINRE